MLLNIWLSLWVESLSTLNESLCAAQLFPTVPFTEALTCALVQDEVDKTLLLVCNAEFVEDSNVLCWQLV